LSQLRIGQTIISNLPPVFSLVRRKIGPSSGKGLRI